jgi:hypothetical protein
MKRLPISLAIAFVTLMSNALAQGPETQFSPAELTKRMQERRAVEAAIWGMPIEAQSRRFGGPLHRSEATRRSGG